MDNFDLIQRQFSAQMIEIIIVICLFYFMYLFLIVCRMCNGYRVEKGANIGEINERRTGVKTSVEQMVTNALSQ